MNAILDVIEQHVEEAGATEGGMLISLAPATTMVDAELKPFTADAPLAEPELFDSNRPDDEPE